MSETPRPFWGSRRFRPYWDDGRKGWIARVTWRELRTGHEIDAEASEVFADYREAVVASRYLGFVKGVFDERVAANPPDMDSLDLCARTLRDLFTGLPDEPLPDQQGNIGLTEWLRRQDTGDWSSSTSQQPGDEDDPSQ